MTPTPVRALVVDDNLVVRAGLVALLEATGTVTVLDEAGNGKEAIEKARQLGPDIVLLDVRMPLLDGVSALEELTSVAPVIMLTHTDTPDIIQTALRKGASGYLVHGEFSADDLSAAVTGVVHGDSNPMSPVAVRAMLSVLRDGPVQEPAATPEETGARLGLSAREAEVVLLMTHGLSNSEIARQLFLSEKTIKNHVTHIYSKLQVNTRAAAIARWNGTDKATADSRLAPGGR